MQERAYKRYTYQRVSILKKEETLFNFYIPRGRSIEQVYQAIVSVLDDSPNATAVRIRNLRGTITDYPLPLVLEALLLAEEKDAAAAKAAESDLEAENDGTDQE